MPNPNRSALPAPRIDRHSRRRSPRAGNLPCRTSPTTAAARGLRAGSAQAACPPPSDLRRAPVSILYSCQHLLVPAARFLRPGFVFFCFAHPNFGGAERRESSGACEAPVGLHLTRQARRLARRLASHTGDARLPALHRGDFWLRCRASVTAARRRFRSGEPSSRPGRSARRSAFRRLPERTVPEPFAAGRHSSLRIQVWLENSPRMSEGAHYVPITQLVVKNYIRSVIRPRQPRWTTRFRIGRRDGLFQLSTWRAARIRVGRRRG